MTREEEIKCASKDYVNYLLDKQEYHNEDYTEDDIRQAFEKGAMFADKNPDLSSLWHDASDNHTEATLILYRTTSGECEVTELACTSEGVWHLFVKEYEVAEWADIEDLLPKGGEK